MPMENLSLLYEITQVLTAPGPLPRRLSIENVPFAFAELPTTGPS